MSAPSLLEAGAQPLVLASGSRFRARMMTDAGLAFTVDRPSVDEASVRESMQADGAPVEHATEMLAEMKATTVSRRHPGALVVGADQILEKDGRWYEKPTGRAAALEQLASLAGARHRLVSSVVVAENGVRVWHHTDQAQLDMRPLGPAFLERYLDVMADRVGDTVGGYELEGLGVQLFSSVRGDFFTVIGLPLLPLLAFLRQRRVIAE